MIGKTVSHYHILEKLGEGGMGEVYLAHDTVLDRKVALKFLPPFLQANPNAKQRFLREAKSAAALDHPYICKIHEIGEVDDAPFIVMEYVEGKTLKERLERGPLTLNDAMQIARELVEAVAEAHEKGIVHRDLKPSNIMLTPKGHAKVMDFGLAKHFGLPEQEEQEITTALTREGSTLGTLAYMSPEQALGRPVDSRSDVFSLGVVLCEMFTGKHPFQRDSAPATLMAIENDPVFALVEFRPEIPSELDAVVRHCLEKDPAARYSSAGQVWKDLVVCQSRLAAPVVETKAILLRPQVVLPVLLLLVGLAGVLGWLWIHSSRVDWARNQLLPEITRSLEERNFVSAFSLIQQAEDYIAEDAELQRLKETASRTLTLQTTPDGAEVFYRAYGAAEQEWHYVGRSPIEESRVPAGPLHWKVTKEGFEIVEMALAGLLVPLKLDIKLDPQGTGLPGMIRVPSGTYQLGSAEPVELEDYWLDKYEVTNQQFKEFVDAGGYQQPEYWKHPFVKEGRALSWEEAMAEFRDTTGRPGPATWKFSSHPEGEANHPVRGVSWYEAAAYAEFAGKSLPTVYHWRRASGLPGFTWILPHANFGGDSPVPVGSYPSLSPHGHYDLAGNVKEWCWNASGERRYLLGGAWNEPEYSFFHQDPRPPLERLPNQGFRCAKYNTALSEKLSAPLDTLERDYSRERPVDEETFKAYKGLYTYDRTRLDARIESVDESSTYWRKETITFNAPHETGRMIAYLFLPRGASPPYQTVIFFPGSGAILMRSRSSKTLFEAIFFEFIPRGGRALLYPIYKGTYERGDAQIPRGPSVQRDEVIHWGKEVGRCIDYLESRDDIDADKLAYLGFSLGARVGPILTAVEERFKVSVLQFGGFGGEPPGETNPVNFAPRSRIPVLMINGRSDFIFPLQTSQIPMFKLLGAAEKDKRHVVIEGGHVPLNWNAVVKETLDWLDHYLGPVRR